MQAKSSEKSLLGIHRDLLTQGCALMIGGLLVFAMGLLILLAIFIPQIGALFGGLNLGVRFLFFLVSLFFFWLAYLACIVNPLHYRRITQTVAHTSPRPVQLKLTEVRDSDSSEFFVDLCDGATRSYPAKRPRWITASLLNTPLEGLAYFDARERLAAIRLEQGLVWLIYPSSRMFNKP